MRGNDFLRHGFTQRASWLWSQSGAEEASRELGALFFWMRFRGRSAGGIWRITSRSALQQRDSHCLQTLSIQASQGLAPNLSVLLYNTLQQRQTRGLSCILGTESCPGASSSWVANSHKKSSIFTFSLIQLLSLPSF